MQKKLCYTFLFVFLLVSGFAQMQQLTLEQTLNIAQLQSLNSFKAKNTFLAEYWNYQSYKSKQKPHLTWNFRPATYKRSMTLRYDYVNDLEIYRQQQTFSSYSSLNLSQNIVATGGTVYMESNLYRLQNVGTTINSWSSTPVEIGFNQPLFAYNSFKWEKIISPIAYEQARQEYIETIQKTNITAVTYFFNLLLAKMNLTIAANNVSTADTLYRIGQKRFEIASIQQEELVDLELSKFNAKIELAQAEKNLQKALFNLRSFLGLDGNEELNPALPSINKTLQIDSKTAVDLAKMYNPQMLDLKTKQLEAERSLDRATKNARFNADLSASYGLNQAANNFSASYQNPLDQQMISISVSVPLLDWGDRKGQILMAQSRKEIADIEVKQALVDFEQEVILKVIDFNLQAQVVESAAKASELAKQSYELTKRRFILGKADVLKLTSSMTAMQSASEKYIGSLATYWQYYYQVQRLTLYDFIQRKALSARFDEIVNNQSR